ncbi:hypothetical protein QQM39_19005 [Streptomyces sp. DT2A-34]|uniref:hypothetical protein n=1 Tax=Streptomyces sp. DT2A-34 TaxID=3051182 RepID=UPI00265C44F4|nr:hypothetical protein [Streptomyces sp. DT2A-34]MDO0912855.1 hypothetical protein [Streptomyces sp. DT2A-34]
MVELLREWIDGSGVTARGIWEQKLLVPEDFANGVVPGREAFLAQLRGRRLSRDLCEAIARICTPDGDQELLQSRYDVIEEKLKKAAEAPTPVVSDDYAELRRQIADLQRQLQAGVLTARAAPEEPALGRSTSSSATAVPPERGILPSAATAAGPGAPDLNTREDRASRSRDDGPRLVDEFEYPEGLLPEELAFFTELNRLRVEYGWSLSQLKEEAGSSMVGWARTFYGQAMPGIEMIGYLILSQGLNATLLDLYEAAEQARGRDASNTTLDPSDVPAAIRKLEEFTRYNALDPLLEHVVFTWPAERLAHLLIAMEEEESSTNAVVMSEAAEQLPPEAIVELAATLAKNPSPHGADEATAFLRWVGRARPDRTVSETVALLHANQQFDLVTALLDGASQRRR